MKDDYTTFLSPSLRQLQVSRIVTHQTLNPNVFRWRVMMLLGRHASRFTNHALWFTLLWTFTRNVVKFWILRKIVEPVIDFGLSGLHAGDTVRVKLAIVW